jgi:hypothetical protein
LTFTTQAAGERIVLRVRVLLSSAFLYQDIFRHAARALRSP